MQLNVKVCSADLRKRYYSGKEVSSSGKMRKMLAMGEFCTFLIVRCQNICGWLPPVFDYGKRVGDSRQLNRGKFRGLILEGTHRLVAVDFMKCVFADLI